MIMMCGRQKTPGERRKKRNNNGGFVQLISLWMWWNLWSGPVYGESRLGTSMGKWTKGYSKKAKAEKESCCRTTKWGVIVYKDDTFRTHIHLICRACVNTRGDSLYMISTVLRELLKRARGESGKWWKLFWRMCVNVMTCCWKLAQYWQENMHTLLCVSRVLNSIEMGCLSCSRSPTYHILDMWVRSSMDYKNNFHPPHTSHSHSALLAAVVVAAVVPNGVTISVMPRSPQPCHRQKQKIF